MRQSLEMFTRCLWVCALTGAGKGSKPLMATLPVPPHTVGIYPGETDGFWQGSRPVCPECWSRLDGNLQRCNLTLLTGKLRHRAIGYVQLNQSQRHNQSRTASYTRGLLSPTCHHVWGRWHFPLCPLHGTSSPCCAGSGRK